MVHFDSNGAYITPFFNYHDDPHMFIRLVLGLSSTKETVLGLDTSIQWEIKAGQKVSGKIAVSQSRHGEDIPPLYYPLKNLRPVFTRSSISGRRTTCWLATQDNGKDVIIKDAWHTSGRTPEYKYLKAGKDIAGVAKLVHHKVVSHTAEYRPTYYAEDFLFCYDRDKLRIVIEAYGLNLKNYRSRYEFVAALRDTIRGIVTICFSWLSVDDFRLPHLAHRRLYARGILHRDISLYNILLGEDLHDHQRLLKDCICGFLIDFDMAIFHDKRTRDEISVQVKSVRRDISSEFSCLFAESQT